MVQNLSVIACGVLALINLVGAVFIDDKESREHWITRSVVYIAAILVITAN